MGTVSKFVSGNLNNANEKYIMTPKKEAGRPIIIENVLDFSKIPVSAADVVQALKVPANCVVTKVGAYVMTGEGATCTATIGDEANADGWDTDANLETTGTSNVSSEADATDAYSAGKVYTADDTIDLVMGHNTDAAKVCVWAMIYVLGTDLA